MQALSTDAATSNVELHYAYICDAYGAFMARYRQQAAAHAGALGTGMQTAGSMWACYLPRCRRSLTDRLPPALPWTPALESCCQTVLLSHNACCRCAVSV